MITLVSGFNIIRNNQAKCSSGNHFHWHVNGRAIDLVTAGQHKTLIMIEGLPSRNVDFTPGFSTCHVVKGVIMGSGKYLKRNKKISRGTKAHNIDLSVVRGKINDLIHMDIRSIWSQLTKTVYNENYIEDDYARYYPIERVFISGTGEIVAITMSMYGLVYKVKGDINHFKRKLAVAVMQLMEANNKPYGLDKDDELLFKLSSGIIDGHISELLFTFVLTPLESELIEIESF